MTQHNKNNIFVLPVLRWDQMCKIKKKLTTGISLIFNIKLKFTWKLFQVNNHWALGVQETRVGPHLHQETQPSGDWNQPVLIYRNCLNVTSRGKPLRYSEAFISYDQSWLAVDCGAWCAHFGLTKSQNGCMFSQQLKMNSAQTDCSKDNCRQC